MSVSQETPFTPQTSTPLRSCLATAAAALFGSPSVSSLDSVSSRRQNQIYRSRSSSLVRSFGKFLILFLENSNMRIYTAECTLFGEEGEDENTTLGKRARINKKTKDYLMFLPKRKDGLYKKLAEEGTECSKVII